LDGGLPVFRNLEAGLKPCLVEAGRVTASLGGLGKTEIRKALGRPDPFLDFVIASTRSSPEIDGLSHSGGGPLPYNKLALLSKLRWRDAKLDRPEAANALINARRQLSTLPPQTNQPYVSATRGRAFS
jgi:hypothetical protein